MVLPEKIQFDRIYVIYILTDPREFFLPYDLLHCARHKTYFHLADVLCVVTSRGEDEERKKESERNGDCAINVSLHSQIPDSTEPDKRTLMKDPARRRLIFLRSLLVAIRGD